jgi:hypothetical protein
VVWEMCCPGNTSAQALPAKEAPNSRWSKLGIPVVYFFLFAATGSIEPFISLFFSSVGYTGQREGAVRD